MIFGFYGSLANNTYVASKAFYDQGAKVVYLREIGDNFPFSQPVWEDNEFILEFEEVDPSKWTASRWADKEREVGWLPPTFVKSPDQCGVYCIKKYKEKIFQRLLKIVLCLRGGHRRFVINSMQQADVWIVCGIEPAILARASGKPYVIWPHGGDIRFAAGFGFSFRNLLGRGLLTEINRWLLRISYKGALFIGSHDPRGIGGHIGCVQYPIINFPLPMPLKYRPIDGVEKQHNLVILFDRYGIKLPQVKYYVFIPSRIDYFWKGTDRLIAAIKSASLQNTHFIFSGWGCDYFNAIEQLNEVGVTFLPFSMSKPFLFKVYENVALVVDQFCFGSYGTSALEAMSIGTPVMMHIDNAIFLDRCWTPPPVINVQSSKEIAEVLQQIDDGKFPLSDYSTRSVEWFNATHEESVSVPRVIEKIKHALEKMPHVQK